MYIHTYVLMKKNQRKSSYLNKWNYCQSSRATLQFLLSF